MNLYIETENGQTKNHPALEENLLAAFGSIPSHWEPFERVARPVPGVYQVLDSETPTYQKVNGTWTDVWALREMTPTEKSAKKQAARDAWAALPNAANFTTWTLDEDTCTMVPPTARPEGNYAWKGATNSWELRAAYPTDGKAYRWDYQSWSWVEVV